MAKIKKMIGFEVDLLKRIDEYAKNMGIDRTAAISVLVNKGLEVEKN